MRFALRRFTGAVDPLKSRRYPTVDASHAANASKPHSSAEIGIPSTIPLMQFLPLHGGIARSSRIVSPFSPGYGVAHFWPVRVV